MKKVFTMMMVALFLCAANVANAQKIGIVSPDEVFASMADTKKADTLLQAFQKALLDNAAEEEQELNTAIEKFYKDSIKMTAPAKEAKRLSLQEKIQGMQGKQEELNKKLEAKKEEILKPIREKMLKAIQDVAKEAGYGYVLYKEQAIVFPESEDITDKVKAKLGIKTK
jgi:outer membrane protein